MVVPVIIGAIRLGQVIYRVASSPAGQALAKKAIDKYGANVVKKTAKELKNKKYISNKVLKQKDPTIPQRIGGPINRILGRGKDSIITKKSPGVNKPTAGISGPRQAAEKTGRVVIGGVTVGGAVAGVYEKLSASNKKEVKKAVEDARKQGKQEGQIETLLRQAINEQKKEEAAKKKPMPSKNKPMPRPKNLVRKGAVLSSKPPLKRPKNLTKK